ncbi:MAG: tyrosinase [Acidobacteriota bacterium]|jgi:tyrosinase|nr:tyrosinase [Acidobacteriota bacterium]
MKVELQINNSVSPGARYVSWAPSPCRIRVTNAAGTVLPTVNIKISSVSPPSGGMVVFRKGTTGSFSTTLSLVVPTNGTTVPFFVAGRFGRPSINDGDVTIEAHANLTLPISIPTLVGSVRVMVRIRKNAESLTPGERDRFVAAFAQLNNQGAGRFQDFRDMHTDVSSPQAHGAPGFLPWHRAYILDLERELQAIDSSVALPYWRFDQPAPNLFTGDFIGVSGSNGNVQFSNNNPLQFWVTDHAQGIVRGPRNNWNPATQPGPTVKTEAQTLALGTQYPAFSSMPNGLEGNPHGTAHTRWDGFLRQIPTAAKDPLFFLLHCNVDRLWAKWQRLNGRFDPAQAASFDSNPGNPIGHNLVDTMWPWNGITAPPRPPTAPGGPMASSPCVSAPGPQPRVRSSLDYQGSVNALSREGFDYDDVKFA